MRLRISTLALTAALATIFVGPANAKPTEMQGKVPPEMQEKLVQQICASKNTSDCVSKTKDCLALMDSMPKGGAPTCPGLSTEECLKRMMECAEIISGGKGGPPGTHEMGHPPGHGSQGGSPPGNWSHGGGPMMGGMKDAMQQQAAHVCSYSDEPTCRDEVMACLALAEKVMGPSAMTSKPNPSMCAGAKIPDCETKLMACDAKLQALVKKMGSSASEEETSGEMPIDEGSSMTPEQTAMIMCTVSQDAECMDKVKNCLVLSNNMIHSMNMSTNPDPKICGGADMAECMTKMKKCNELMEGLTKQMDSLHAGDMSGEEEETAGGQVTHPAKPKEGKRRRRRDAPSDQEIPGKRKGKRNVDGGGEEEDDDDEEDDDEDEAPKRPVAHLDSFVRQVDHMLRQIDEMLAQFSAMMGVIETVMDGTTQVVAMRPGVLSRKEKGMYLSKYICKHANIKDCAFMTEECAVWLAPSPNLPVMKGMEANCSSLVPPPSSVADHCMDFSTDECKNEAVSCMNLLIATGGTSGYAGPLTAHADHCEEMLMRMISSVTCSGKSNVTECEMTIDVCMDTIRVKTDELHDHHFPEKLMCEPVMRPAIALYMCSNRDEPDCFSRMHKCLVHMAPDYEDVKGLDPKEMVGCLKLTRPPVQLICTPEEGEDCKKKYDTCNKLIQPNAEFMKASQTCMALPDEKGAKDCLQPALNDMTKTIDNVSVQGGVKDLFKNFWTPSMGLVGFHSCMMMVCTLELK
ncbi:uncharacterized protein [Macrobrachium rosenbergii]|uniref:uncharacterized protein n=1 Tax=Macrobrachium rosenbergii TaxID=79674 RepID=UPI0034D79099